MDIHRSFSTERRIDQTGFAKQNLIALDTGLYPIIAAIATVLGLFVRATEEDGKNGLASYVGLMCPWK
jgi:hypothetical protein